MATVQQILQAKINNQFSKYIDYIRFPKYKNLVKDTKITFDFPITVFVGKNGSGKSSVLKSVYGCIEGKNISDYWFSTKIDPIEEGDGDRNCFIYNYPSSANESNYEVLIQRAPRKGNPDYWETAKPVAKYGMNLNQQSKSYRKKKLVTTVHYLDFHAVMSAFDKFRYFLNSERIIESNNYLRNKTKSLVKALANNEVIQQGRPPKNQNELPYTLSQNELREITNILGKRYTRTQVIKHKFFKLWGHSTVFNNNGIAYSEAFAGSGENAVVTLVREILNAANHSIILLDEPETCLHPGAQKKIFEFLIEQCHRKKLQIIISTHSKEFLKDLPNNAIKVFNELPDGTIEVINECNPTNAFYYIGEDVENKKSIIVEDKLTNELIESVAKDISLATSNQINVQFPSGGSKEIKKSIAWYSKLNEENKFIIFDGDELVDANKAQINICNSDTITLGNRNVNYLQNIIKQQIQIEQLNFFGFNSNESDENKINAYINYLNFFRDKVKFLPLNTPEEIIWNQDFLNSLPMLSDENKNEIMNEPNFKQKFRLCSLYVFRNDNSESIFSAQKIFITNWLKNKDANYLAIQQTIENIINS
jgi:predicted ATPase